MLCLLCLRHRLRRLVRLGLRGRRHHGRTKGLHSSCGLSLHHSVMYTLTVVSCCASWLWRGQITIVDRCHSLLLIDSALVGIAAGLLQLWAGVIVMLSTGCVLWGVLIRVLHMNDLGLFVDWICRRPRCAYGVRLQRWTAAASLIGSMLRLWLLMQGCLWLCSILVRIPNRDTASEGRGVAGRRRSNTALSLLAETLLGIQALQATLRPAIQGCMLSGVGRGLAGSVVHGRRVGARHHW